MWCTVSVQPWRSYEHFAAVFWSEHSFCHFKVTVNRESRCKHTFPKWPLPRTEIQLKSSIFNPSFLLNYNTKVYEYLASANSFSGFSIFNLYSLNLIPDIKYSVTYCRDGWIEGCRLGFGLLFSPGDCLFLPKQTVRDNDTQSNVVNF